MFARRFRLLIELTELTLRRGSLGLFLSLRKYEFQFPRACLTTVSICQVLWSVFGVFENGSFGKGTLLHEILDQARHS